MKTLTFDWNCVIAVEKGEDSARYVKSLVDLHFKEKIEVAITTVSASENLVGSKEFPASSTQFRERLERLGWQNLPWVLGPGVIGLTYWGMCKWVGDCINQERDALWSVIGGNTRRELPGNLSDEELRSPAHRKWRNVWCDVHTVWAHIDSGRDVFITANTHDFHKKFDALQALGLKDVKTPQEMVEQLKL